MGRNGAINRKARPLARRRNGGNVDSNTKKLMDACQELIDAVSELKQENLFLAECVTNLNNGKYVRERKLLLEEVEAKEEALASRAEEVRRAEARLKQEEKKVETRKQTVESREKEFDQFISSASRQQADRKIRQHSEMLREEIRTKQEAFDVEYERFREETQAKLQKYKIAAIASIFVAAAAIAAGILMGVA